MATKPFLTIRSRDLAFYIGLRRYLCLKLFSNCSHLEFNKFPIYSCNKSQILEKLPEHNI